MPRFADQSLPPRPLRRFAGAALSLAIAGLIAGLLTVIWLNARDAPSQGVSGLGAILWSATLQASLSTACSLLIGIVIAWALNRIDFPGRALVVASLSAAIVTPGIIIAFGLISVWGRSGWLGGLGLPIFGLSGVVFAHVILDASFVARILLTRLDAIPSDRLKTGQSLRLSAWTRFRVLDWPAIAPSLPGLAGIVFLLSFTSFPVVLLLGGGPAVQTLEVAIYSAVRLDFDLPRAVLLALLQLGLCTVILVVTAANTPSLPRSGPLAPQCWRDSAPVRAVQTALILLCLVLFLLPVLAILFDGVAGLGALMGEASFWRALATSLAIAGTSALLTLVLAIVLAGARATLHTRAGRLALFLPGYAYLAVPAVTLALGAFLLVRQLGASPDAVAPFVLIIANALLSLPYALATLAPPLLTIATTRGRLIRSLRLTGRRQFTAIEWPLLAPEAAVVLAIAFCFSLGDLGVIALFGSTDLVTLPLLMLRALGAYRSHDAAAIAALMLTIAILAFFALPRLIRRSAHA